MSTTIPNNEAPLRLHLLGPIDIEYEGKSQALPRSKKTRALLAYLAVTGRSHRRDRLCDLLWDITDDPRGALRWSLSRLRKAVEWDRPRLIASRDEVHLDTEGMAVDAHVMAALVQEGLSNATTDELKWIASIPRGSFLEGLELPDLMSFNAWLVAQREQFREHRCAVLAALVQRLATSSSEALPYARTWAEEDVFSVPAHTELLRLLVADGKMDEAEQRYDNCRRLFRELGASGGGEVERAWRSISVQRSIAPAVAPIELRPQLKTTVIGPFVGRKDELRILDEELEHAKEDKSTRSLLITAEPGGGKSRLAERLTTRALSAGFTVLRGRAYEAEGRRAYGPWVDALQVDFGELVSADGSPASSREALFAAVMDRLEACAGRGALLILDDVQWLDRDSLELLHLVARSYDRGPLAIVLFARTGELNDNEAATRAIRSLRHEQRLRSLPLPPLLEADIAELIAEHPEVDASFVHRTSAGNPLYAIELARAGVSSAADASASIVALVRERVEQLPSDAANVLRWGAVLGRNMSVSRLEALCALELEELVAALEVLEAHALLRIDASRSSERYVFGHDVVREAVYSDLSFPRRRLMHKKVVDLLAAHTSDVAVATEVSHHAGLAGVALPGVRACLVAGTRSLRLFANSDAESLARRGLALAKELEGADRITSSLELLHLQYSARTPNREQAAEKVRVLAEAALDLGLTYAARLGFQMLSFLRWESSSLAAAHANIMQAERVSRSAEPAERSVALAQAAKCLVLLEKNLNQAEAFVLEAGGLVHRGVCPHGSVCLSDGMIAAHRGESEKAIESLREARQLAREQGERLLEFAAVEQWVMMQIDHRCAGNDPALAEELADLGGKVRPGCEAASGRALLGLSRLCRGEAEAEEPIREALAELRRIDAKYQLAFVLSRFARLLFEQGKRAEAEVVAREAIVIGEALGRPSEQAYGRTLIARIAVDTGDEELASTQIASLQSLLAHELSHGTQTLMRELLSDRLDWPTRDHQSRA